MTETGAAPRRLEALQFVRLEVAPAPRIASELVVLVGSARVVVERGFDAELLRAVVEALATKGGT